MGASGATVGVGTPLMNMIETAAGIERDKARLTRAAELEIEYREGEIAATEELLDEPEPELEPESELEPWKKKLPKKPHSRISGGYGQN